MGTQLIRNKDSIETCFKRTTRILPLFDEAFSFRDFSVSSDFSVDFEAARCAHQFYLRLFESTRLMDDAGDDFTMYYRRRDFLFHFFILQAKRCESNFFCLLQIDIVENRPMNRKTWKEFRKSSVGKIAGNLNSFLFINQESSIEIFTINTLYVAH